MDWPMWAKIGCNCDLILAFRTKFISVQSLTDMIAESRLNNDPWNKEESKGQIVILNICISIPCRNFPLRPRWGKERTSCFNLYVLRTTKTTQNVQVITKKEQEQKSFGDLFLKRNHLFFTLKKLVTKIIMGRPKKIPFQADNQPPITQFLRRPPQR